MESGYYWARMLKGNPPFVVFINNELKEEYRGAKTWGDIFKRGELKILEYYLEPKAYLPGHTKPIKVSELEIISKVEPPNEVQR